MIGLPGVVVDGNDVWAVYRVVEGAVQGAKGRVNLLAKRERREQ
jgi:TPP-dependent pyruvate/acetoin dehydrogenase alpha subunit